MCGICGIWSRSEAGEKLEADVLRMIGRMSHRGTEQGTHFGPGIALGSRRLPILDVQGSCQPLFNEDRSIALVGHGEIYNHVELRGELEDMGHRFATAGDLECILHLYESLGSGFASRLQGQFAIALWDPHAKALLLCRDRMGICPLFYAAEQGRLAFASDLNALRTLTWIDDSIDVRSLYHYLSLCYVPGPSTIYEGISSVKPGHVVIWKDETISEEPFWKPSSLIRQAPPSELQEELALRLRESVALRLRCDVDWGILLSGGLDSSTILALAARETAREIPCFTIAYAERAFDESDRASSIAAHFGARANRVVLGPQDLASHMNGFLAAMDQPLADESCFPLYMVDKEAGRSVRVLLSGEGGDESFGGYETYQAYLAAGWYQRVPRPLKAAARFAADLLPASDAPIGASYRIRAFVTGAEKPVAAAHLWWRIAFDDSEKRALLNPEFTPGSSGESTEELFESAFLASPFDTDLGRLMHLDRSLYLADDLLCKADRMGMASTLETRFPLLDDRLVEFASAVPAHLHVSGLMPWQSKALLRKVAAGLLPSGRWRTRKRGFNMPIATYLRGPWSWLVDEYLSESALREAGFFRPSEVVELVSGFRRRKPVRVRALWALLVFMMWHKSR